MLALLLAGLVTVLACAALDLCAYPQSPPWHRRSAKAIGLHLAASVGLLVFFLLVSSRLLVSVLCAVGIFAVMVLVSNAKFKALREPLVFSDLALFAQSLWHPRLYFPFLTLTQRVSLPLGAVLLGLLFWLEKPLAWNATVVLAGSWLILFVFQKVVARAIPFSFIPVEDQASYGFFAVFVGYLLNGLSRRELRATQNQLAASPYAGVGSVANGLTKAALIDVPDVVVIQSESFFDVRKIGVRLAPGVFTAYDALLATAAASGELAVPAWGANTMRTEHAFLTALPNAALRYARFYPYLYVVRDTPTLPQALRSQGYRCRAVHPYAATFFGRDKVFPRLGFDEFVDQSAFVAASRSGPYIADAALTDWLINALDASAEQPQFIFAVTMENHGPLHLETATAAEAKSLYDLPEGKVIDDLTVYIRHLVNAENMLVRLTRYLASRKRPTILCFYGDHVPGMAAVYQALGVNPQASNYLIWCNDTANGTPVGQQVDTLSPEQLSKRIAAACGIV